MVSGFTQTLHGALRPALASLAGLSLLALPACGDSGAGSTMTEGDSSAGTEDTAETQGTDGSTGGSTTGDPSAGTEGSDSDGTGGTDGSSGGVDTIDEDAVAAEVLEFDQGGFTKINLAPVPSAHIATRVDIWVPNDSAELYFLIDPPDYSTPVTFPEGTTIVKRHFTDEAATMVDGFTVMHKGPAGYAPAGNDWWWARINEDGSIALGGDGSGGTQFCLDCHAPASNTDLVLGIDPAEHDNP